jgi:hypothetical protein
MKKEGGSTGPVLTHPAGQSSGVFAETCIGARWDLLTNSVVSRSRKHAPHRLPESWESIDDQPVVVAASWRCRHSALLSRRAGGDRYVMPRLTLVVMGTPLRKHIITDPQSTRYVRPLSLWPPSKSAITKMLALDARVWITPTNSHLQYRPMFYAQDFQNHHILSDHGRA